MSSISICAFIIWSFTLAYHVKALEIGIGGGGITIGFGGGGGTSPSPSQPPAQDCPPPPPPPPSPEIFPPPPPPPLPLQSPPPPPIPKQPTPSRPPPPKHAPPEPPHGDLNQRLIRDRQTILNFKKKILKNPKVNDPKNITASWTEHGNPCNYRGFSCSKNPTYGRRYTISDVQFNGFGFGGVKLEGFIDLLKDVSIFHANSNNFIGGVPSITSTSLNYLFELDLSNNKLTGEFPYQVLQATNLTFLDLRFNTFTGKVPGQVFFLDVDVLFINNNNFFQPLPKEVGSTPALYLTLANNRFIGSIPETIGNARKTLLEVLFLNNILSGCLPWQIGLLKLARVFDASKNSLHGPIPTSFACLENMMILNFKHNNLYGVVPEMLCALPNLRNLTLSYNYFTEVGPKCRKLIDNKVLHIEMNCIRDLDPQSPQRRPGECTEFFRKPWTPCPNPDLHAPCKAAKYGNGGGGGGGGNGRRLLEVGPVLSATYGALNPV